MNVRTSRVVVMFVAAALVAAACNQEEESAPPQAQETPEAPPVCPLTGEDIPAEVELPRPAVAVKIENSPQSRPQAGLGEADLVFEEIVEGGITRFAAIFHCGGGKKIGPVRSARFDDPKIIKPFTRVLAYAGANDQVERELRARKMMVFTDRDDPAKAFFRDPPGSTDVHTLFVDVEKIGDQVSPADEGVRPPIGLLEFGDLPAEAEPARSVSVNFSTSNQVVYRWRNGAWRRFQNGEPFRVNPGGQIAVPNVLVQEVRVDPSQTIMDVAGNASPDISLKGKGSAFLFRDGSVIRGTWQIGDDGTPSFTTDDGEAFVFALGPIWVELVPSKKGRIKGDITFRSVRK